MEYQFNNGNLTVPVIESPTSIPRLGHEVRFRTQAGGVATQKIQFIRYGDFDSQTPAGLRRYLFGLSLDENTKMGLSRRIGVSVRSVGADGGLGDWWDAPDAFNPPPPKPTVTYVSTVNSAVVRFALPEAAPDLTGWDIIVSTNGSLNPLTAMPTERGFQGNAYPLTLAGTAPVYFWCAARDSLGGTELNWSDRLEVLPFDPANIIDRSVVDDWVEEEIDKFKNGDLSTILLNHTNSVTGAIGGIRSEVTAVDNRITSEKAQILADVDGKIAAISYEGLETEITDIKSRVTQTETSVTTFGQNLTQAETKLTQQTTKLDAELARTNVLFATTLPGIQSSVTNEAQVRANQDTALGTLITNLTTTVGNNRTAFDQQVQLQSDNHSAQGTLITNLTGRVGSAESSISSLQTVTTNGTFATASSQSVLSGRVGTAEGRISSLESVTSNGTFASASIVSSISARLNNGGDIRAAIDSTYAVAVDAQGKANAQATLLLNAQGKIAGYRINNNGDTTTFDIQADRFRISDGSGTNIAPFRVENGLTVMQNARVDGNLVVNGTLNGEKIANDALTGVVAAYNAGLINLNNNNATRLHGAWINVQKAGSPIDINFNSWATFTHNAGGSFSAIVQLVRSRDETGGQVIQTVQINGSGMSNDTWQGPIPVMFIDNPGATGNWHYYVQIYFTVGNMSTQSVTARYCKLTELKNNTISLGQGTGSGTGSGSGYSGGGGGGGGGGGYDPELPGGGGYEQQPTVT